MEYKTCPVFIIKADDEQGTVETIFAVFGNLDKGRDIIHPGAFAKTFVEHGARVKVLDRHQTDSVLRVLGKPLAFRELERAELPTDLLARYPEATGGAWAEVQFNIKTQAGHDVYQHFKAGDIDEWSFGYDPLDYDFSEVNKIQARNLRTVKLYELSPVVWGMNPATTTTAVKAEVKPVEETENTIRVQVRDLDNFQEGSIRTITISEEQGIQALVGRLPGETTMTVGTYIFDKAKGWTKAKAEKWVEEHEKSKQELLAYFDTVDFQGATDLAGKIQVVLDFVRDKAGDGGDTTHPAKGGAGPGDEVSTLLKVIEIRREQLKLLEA